MSEWTSLVRNSADRKCMYATNLPSRLYADGYKMSQIWNKIGRRPKKLFADTTQQDVIAVLIIFFDR